MAEDFKVREASMSEFDQDLELRVQSVLASSEPEPAEAVSPAVLQADARMLLALSETEQPLQDLQGVRGLYVVGVRNDRMYTINAAGEVFVLPARILANWQMVQFFGGMIAFPAGLASLALALVSEVGWGVALLMAGIGALGLATLLTQGGLKWRLRRAARPPVAGEVREADEVIRSALIWRLERVESRRRRRQEIAALTPDAVRARLAGAA